MNQNTNHVISLPPGLIYQQLTKENLIDFSQTNQGITITSCLLALGLLAIIPDGKKGQLATGYWGGKKEKKAARKKAQEQMANLSRNSVALYVGTPEDIQKRQEQEWIKQGKLKKQRKPEAFNWFKPAAESLYLPDAQRGIAAIGASGSGKSFSVCDPLIRSSLDQGFPTIIYDFKYPAQAKRAVGYALKRGYKVHIFAPGFPESDVCNPLDLLKDEEDAIAAGQIAQVINRNTDLTGGKASGDKFFEDAGDSLVEGIFLLTKAVGTLVENQRYCDIMTAQAILSLPDLVSRLEFASQEKLNVWTTRPLSQIISIKESEKTVAGIIGIAQRTFQKFLKKDFMGAFCGKTTLPLDLEGKQLIVFGLDRNNRDIVGPLLATILHMVINRNVSRIKPRTDPLVVSLDELPSLYLPQLVNWLNENREDGFCGILGYQNLGQLENRYGKELTRAILGGTATKFIFNPQDPDSAKTFSDLLGEFQIHFKSKSKSSGTGGSSHSKSDQKNKRPLLEPAQFIKLPTGKAVIINPAYQRAKESYVPLLEQIQIPESDLKEQEWSENLWESIRDHLIKVKRASHRVSNQQRVRQLKERMALVDQLFPLPTDGARQAPASFSPTPALIPNSGSSSSTATSHWPPRLSDQDVSPDLLEGSF
ncbi:transfer complex protein TrsK [Moorena producens PAL-8-15-08-1]|uniref:Transfer complex protein TrsK n=1 Tax=Moorena producens PAL-8-15-08-1 TaxID=1458985 RepID=A0A1D8TMI5_9CYAN|nr:type IV secretory system conjugative DNA transfer family protein [Moorena producens]AOW98868.1 transfer complex protein TrsK [Moorena producens PAL-8-15-08-1]